MRISRVILALVLAGLGGVFSMSIQHKMHPLRKAMQMGETSIADLTRIGDEVNQADPKPAMGAEMTYALIAKELWGDPKSSEYKLNLNAQKNDIGMPWLNAAGIKRIGFKAVFSSVWDKDEALRIIVMFQALQERYPVEVQTAMFSQNRLEVQGGVYGL